MLLGLAYRIAKYIIYYIVYFIYLDNFNYNKIILLIIRIYRSILIKNKPQIKL